MPNPKIVLCSNIIVCSLQINIGSLTKRVHIYTHQTLKERCRNLFYLSNS